MTTLEKRVEHLEQTVTEVLPAILEHLDGMESRLKQYIDDGNAHLGETLEARLTEKLDARRGP